MRKAGAGTHDLATVLATDLKPAVDRGALSNKALEQQIYDMAVQAGYTGPNKLKPLQAWIDRNAGSAKNAADKVNGFGAALARLPKSESLKVIMQGRGTYAIVNATTGVPYPVRAAAAGAFIAAGTTPTADDVMVRASKGELIVPANMVSAGAVDHLRGSIPGFAAGGYVGNWNLTPQFLTGMYGDFGNAVKSGASQALTAGIAQAVRAGISQAQEAAAAQAMRGLNYLPLGAGGPLSGSAATAAAFAKSIMFAYGWTQAQWPYLNAVAMRESGWNAYAVNPSSGAAGIPQNIAGWSAFRPGDYQAQDRWFEAYISSRYVTPARAWAHEQAYNWYGNGLDGMFSKPTLIGVGERGREHVQVTPVTPGGGRGGDVHVHLHNHGVIGSPGELDMWLTQSMNRLARTGGLTQAVKRAGG
jgi:hypothetical protein